MGIVGCHFQLRLYTAGFQCQLLQPRIDGCRHRLHEAGDMGGYAGGRVPLEALQFGEVLVIVNVAIRPQVQLLVLVITFQGQAIKTQLTGVQLLALDQEVIEGFLVSRCRHRGYITEHVFRGPLGFGLIHSGGGIAQETHDRLGRRCGRFWRSGRFRSNGSFFSGTYQPQLGYLIRPGHCLLLMDTACPFTGGNSPVFLDRVCRPVVRLAVSGLVAPDYQELLADIIVVIQAEDIQAFGDGSTDTGPAGVPGAGEINGHILLCRGSIRPTLAIGSGGRPAVDIAGQVIGGDDDFLVDIVFQVVCPCRPANHRPAGDVEVVAGQFTAGLLVQVYREEFFLRLGHIHIQQPTQGTLFAALRGICLGKAQCFVTVRGFCILIGVHALPP